MADMPNSVYGKGKTDANAMKSEGSSNVPTNTSDYIPHWTVGGNHIGDNFSHNIKQIKTYSHEETRRMTEKDINPADWDSSQD